MSGPVCTASGGADSRHDPQADWRLGASNICLADGHVKYIRNENAGLPFSGGFLNGGADDTNEALPYSYSAWFGPARATVTWNPL